MYLSLIPSFIQNNKVRILQIFEIMMDVSIFIFRTTKIVTFLGFRNTPFVENGKPLPQPTRVVKIATI